MDSILDSVKKILGIPNEDTGFDTDIIMHINSAFMGLSQLGVGQNDSFSIEDNSATWSDFLGDATNLDAVKTCLSLKVQLMFDPPTSSFVLESKRNLIAEYEWRLQAQVENVAIPVVEEEEI